MAKAQRLLIAAGVWAQMSPTEKAIWPVLARWQKCDGGSFYRGGTDIASDSGINLKSVWPAVKGLVGRGLVEKVDRGGTTRGGKPIANTYRMLLPVGLYDRSCTGRESRPVGETGADRSEKRVPTGRRNGTPFPSVTPGGTPGPRAARAGRGRGLLIPGLTREHLADPEQIRTYVLPAAQAAKLVNGSTGETLRLIRAALHASTVNGDPAAVFVSNLRAKRDHGSAELDDRAGQILAAWRTAAVGQGSAPVTVELRADDAVDDNEAKRRIRQDIAKVRASA